MKKYLIFILIIISSFYLHGCGFSNKELAMETVSDFLEGYKQQDESITQMLLGSAGSDSMTYEGISAYFAEKMEYEIVSCQSVGEGVYRVKVVLKTIDFEKLFEKIYDEVSEKYGEEEVVSYLMSSVKTKIDNHEYDIYEAESEVVVRKVKDGFKIQLNNSLANGLTGGMNAYLNSLVGGE